MLRDEYPGLERRKYIRLDSVFPVSFQLLSLDGRQIFSEWIQGFTNNIGRGGICLAINQLAPDLAKILKNAEAKVSLKIEMPLNREPVAAVAKVSWIKDPIGPSHKYLVGLTYEQINPAQNNKIMRYARMRKLFVPVALGIIFVVGFGFSLNTYINIKLIRGNKALVEQLVKIIQESSVAKQKIKMIAREKEELQLRIQTSQLEIKNVEEEKKNLENAGDLEKAQAVKKIRELNSFIEKLSKDRISLQEQMINIQHKENIVTEELLRLDETKTRLEKANIDHMYQWLKVHQNPRTGLVGSFEGDSDIANWAFTYDQS
jgi:PilZ domain